MKPFILPFYLSIVLVQLAFAQGKLEWSETKKLTLEDFKGAPPDPSTETNYVC